ncbi:MAG: prephenate dehydratase [Candidatus Nanohalobium sp.]
MRVALLGPKGTYTHQAAEKYFREFEPVFCSTIREVFESDVEVKFVPIENSLGGGVSDTIDLLKERDVEVTGEVRLPIRHALISNEDSVEDIDTVVSHPQALSQCRKIINSNGWDEKEANSTAQAVEGLESGEAALASEIAAEINDRNVLQKGVQDTDTNVTRFFVLNGERRGSDKSVMILEPGEDRPGLLHAMLSCFSGHVINLSHIQSRPTKKELGDYYFYVEAEDGEGESMDKAVQCLETYGKVQFLGSYSVMEDDKDEEKN